MLLNKHFCEFMINELERVKPTFSYLDPEQFWEMLKFEAGNICKEYSSSHARKEKDKEYNPYLLLSVIQEKMVDP